MFIYSKENNIERLKNPTQKLLTKTQRNLHTFITKTYNTTPKIFKQYITFQLLHNAPTHLVSIFKEHMINDYVEEFLKREYTLIESRERLPKFAKFYKNYLQFFCKATLRHFMLNEIIKNYGEEKAEIYYKENYPEENERNCSSQNYKFINNNQYDDSDSDDDDLINSKSIIFSKSIKEIINKVENGESFFNDINKAMNFPLTQRSLKTLERINIETLNGHIWNPNVDNNTNKNSRNNTIINLLNNLKLKQGNKMKSKRKGNNNTMQVISQKGQKKKCFIKQQIHHKYINNAHYYDTKHKNAMSYTNLKNLIKYNTLLENTFKNSKNHRQTSSFKTVVQHSQQYNKNKNTKIPNMKNGTNHENKSRNKQFESNLNINATNTLTKKKLMNYTYRTVDYHIQSPKIMNKISLIKPEIKPKKRNKVSPIIHHNSNHVNPQNHHYQILSFSSNSITTRKTRTESSLGKNTIVKKITPRVKPLSSIRKNIPNNKRLLMSSPKSAKSNSNSSRNVTTDKAALMKIALSVLLDNHKVKHQQCSKTSSLNINIKNSLHNYHNTYRSRNANRSNIGLESFLKSNYNYHTHNKNLATFLVKKNINLTKKGYGLTKPLPKCKEHRK